MSEPPRRTRRPFAWRNRLSASRRFQSLISAIWPTRGKARREGEALFDLMAGFVHSQVLSALVELGVMRRLLERQADAADLAAELNMPEERARVLLRAGVAIGLLEHRRGRFRTSLRGAALLGVPGLEATIRHHDALYRDLADPVAFFRGETRAQVAGVRPDAWQSGDATGRYPESAIDSQVLVAEETLRHVSLSDVDHLMDIGGGSGAFLREVGRVYRGVEMTLFDLPAAVPAATALLESAGMAGRTRIVPGSFQDDPLPRGADAISLIRVLHGHPDATVMELLRAAFEVLPPGGRLIVSEPMSGGSSPQRPADTFFAVHRMAMRSGRVRSAEEIGDMAEIVGFDSVETPPTHRAFVTSVVLARKAGLRP